MASPVGSPSILAPTYWWFTVRSRLLEETFGPHLRSTDRVLDVGSADGPSVGWLKQVTQRVPLDIDPRGLEAGGVVGSLMALPFVSESFTTVAAFDVLEHCSDEELALNEIERVLTPGGLLFLSVPAYEWAWTSFDEANAHYRRYTKPRLRRALERSGLEPVTLTHGFAGVFPFFAADRLRTRIQERHAPQRTQVTDAVPVLPELSPSVEKLLTSASKVDEALLKRGVSLPFGSSIFALARKRP